MARTWVLLVGLAALLLATAAGCRSKEEDIVITVKNDPLQEARGLLKRYADGEVMGSEAASFPKLVEDVRKVDSAKADVLQKGLDDLQRASPESRKAGAQELLKKL